MARTTRYAGTWYPSKKTELEEFVDRHVPQQKALGAVCPHAGWAYSGKTAGIVYSCMKPAKLYIVIGPDHYGLGSKISFTDQDAWDTPLGKIDVDRDLIRDVVARLPEAEINESAHTREHSLEVQMPFIKLMNPEARMVAVTMNNYSKVLCKSLGESIADVLVKQNKADDTIIIASSDMSHYIPYDYAKKIDAYAIQKILDLDPVGLLDIVKEKEISMCGSGPAATMLWATLKLHATKASLLRYSTSGDANRDKTQVVGYAGIIIT